MALNFWELATSRPVERDYSHTSITLKWIAIGSQDENEVYVGLLLVAPTRWDGYRRKSAKIDPQGGGIWMCEVEYGWDAQTLEKPDQPPAKDFPATDPLGPEWSFDGSAQSVHITQSIKTISKTGRGNNVPFDNKQAIGMTRDSVQGCDIFAPKLEISLTLTFPFVTIQQIGVWSNITARVNNAFFLNWQPGELLYLGPSVTIQPAQMSKVVHKFLAGRNMVKATDKDNLTVVPDLDANGQPAPGAGLILPAKNAHDYVWIAYQNANPDAGAPWVPDIPYAAYVEQVYRSADFTPLLQGA